MLDEAFQQAKRNGEFDKAFSIAYRTDLEMWFNSTFNSNITVEYFYRTSAYWSTDSSICFSKTVKELAEACRKNPRFMLAHKLNYQRPQEREVIKTRFQQDKYLFLSPVIVFQDQIIPLEKRSPWIERTATEDELLDFYLVLYQITDSNDINSLRTARRHSLMEQKRLQDIENQRKQAALLRREAAQREEAEKAQRIEMSRLAKQQRIEEKSRKRELKRLTKPAK